MTTYRIRMTPKFEWRPDPSRGAEFQEIVFDDEAHVITWLGRMNMHNEMAFYSIDEPTQVTPVAEQSIAQELERACTLLAHWYAGGMLTWHLVISTSRERIYRETRALLQAQEARERHVV